MTCTIYDDDIIKGIGWKISIVLFYIACRGCMWSIISLYDGGCEASIK
jgi:hypothetical protein